MKRSNVDLLDASKVIDKERLKADEVTRINKLPAEDIEHLIRIAHKLRPKRRGPFTVQFCF